MTEEDEYECMVAAERRARTGRMMGNNLVVCIDYTYLPRVCKSFCISSKMHAISNIGSNYLH
jgi:hypothetical protein